MKPLTASAWEDGNWTALPMLAGNVNADVCVIGLGGSGLTAIHTLLAAGLHVVGLDASQVAGGAAGANGGFLLAGTAHFYHQARQQLGRQRASDIYHATLQEIQRLYEVMPDVVRRTGSLRIAMSATELKDCELQLAAMREDALPVERYSGPEGEGLLFPSDAVFDPLVRCRRLASSAIDRGAQLYEHSAAVTIQTNEVTTKTGHVHCKQIIIAIDGGLENVLPELIGSVRTARLQMLATAPTHEIDLKYAVYARWGYEYWQQLPDGRLLIGGFRDHEKEAEWTHSVQPSVEIQDRLIRFVRSHLHVQAPITHHWAASVGYTENNLPIVKEIRQGIWAIGGYNGTGNVIGALCGRAVAEYVSKGKSQSLLLLRS